MCVAACVAADGSPLPWQSSGIAQGHRLHSKRVITCKVQDPLKQRWEQTRKANRCTHAFAAESMLRIKGAFHRYHAAFGKCSGYVLVYSCVSAPAESYSCDLSISPNKFLGDQLNILI